MLTSSFKCDVICFFETRKSWKTWKIMKIVNVEGENFQIFWTTWGTSIKFSNTWLMIILKVTKKQCFTLYLPLSLFLSLSLKNLIVMFKMCVYFHTQIATFLNCKSKKQKKFQKKLILHTICQMLSLLSIR